MSLPLPIHPTMRHPLTGEPVQALWVRPDGRACWPLMGGAPDDPPGDGAGGGDGGGGEQENARDDQGRDLGFPTNTALADMDDGQRVAYWQHHAKKHENRNKALLGDRTPEQVRADLESFDKWKREQQTPAEQQLADRYEQGKADQRTESSTTAATAILKASLGFQGYEGDELDELLDLIDVRKFVTDDGDVDTDRLAATARKFSKSDTDNPPRRRDFGGGDRGRGSNGGGSQRGAAGKAALERRHPQAKTGS